MTNAPDTVRLVVEIDIDSFVRGGIADFRGMPHLLVSECLDYDQPKKARRLGATYFLVPLTEKEAHDAVEAYQSAEPADADPEWKEKNRRRWEAWLGFKEAAFARAEWAWHARGNFRSREFRWVLLPGERVSGEALRARLARIDELEGEAEPDPGGAGEEVAF
jgi:hypothetical protein